MKTADSPRQHQAAQSNSNSQSEYEIALPNGLKCFVPERSLVAGVRFDISEIFNRNCYMLPEWRLEPTDVVIDVGANKGICTLWAAPQVPFGRVISLEPAPIFKVLSTNVERNRLANVTALNMAVGRADGQLDLIAYPHGVDGVSHSADLKLPRVTSFFLSRAKPKHITVGTISIGQILQTYDIDKVKLLKIDCEGGEYDIFSAMSPDDWSRIQFVALEFHRFSKVRTESWLLDQLHMNGFQTTIHSSFLERLQSVGFIRAWRK